MASSKDICKRAHDTSMGEYYSIKNRQKVQVILRNYFKLSVWSLGGESLG